MGTKTADRKNQYFDTREHARAWFRDAKFGMFIHWGIYALLGKGEWIRNVDQIPEEDYAQLVPRFKAKKFDPDAWADLAKQAGMKYAVITTKHHDGLCLFDADNTEWKVTRTPYGKDVIKKVTKSFNKKKIPVGFYYSILDWHHDDYLPRMPWEEARRPAAGHNVMDYITYMREHIRQLLTEYRPAPFVLWYDGGWMNKPEDLEGDETNAMARELKPDILINDRHFTREDLITPEQRVPPTGILDENGEPALWEACITMTSHWWGYDAHETTYKSKAFLIRMLVDIVSKGGNLLLNVGPKPDGTIQKEFVTRLKAIGKWMNRYGEAIYETTASPFNLLPFYGRVTTKGSRLYVHVFEWPGDQILRLPNLHNRIVKAVLLGKKKQQLAVTRDGEDWLVALPEKAPDKAASVIAVDLDAPPKTTPLVLRPNKNGVLELPAVFGALDGPHGMRIRYESRDGKIHAGNWINPKDGIEWTCSMPKGGTYRVWLDYAVDPGNGGSEVEIIVNGREIPRLAPNGMIFGSGETESRGGARRQTCRTQSTQGEFKKRKAALVRFRRGSNTIKITVPSIKRSEAMKLRGIILRPAR